MESTIFFIAAMTLVVSPLFSLMSLERSPAPTRLATSPTSRGSAPSCFMTMLAMNRPMATATRAPSTARTVITVLAVPAALLL